MGKAPKQTTEGVDLNAKTLLILGPVCLCPGHLAVKHVAQAGERKTEQSVFCKPLEGENHAHGCGSQSQICQYNRVAVKSYHKIQPQSFVLLVLAL